MTNISPVRGPHKVALGLFALVWLSIIWFGSWQFNPNNSTRLFAAISLVEQHKATIDEFKSLTIDKAEFGNHVYLDKAPGMTVMAMPAVAVANALTGTTSASYPRRINNDGFSGFMQLRLRLAVAMSVAVTTKFSVIRRPPKMWIICKLNLLMPVANTPPVIMPMKPSAVLYPKL